MTTDEGTRVRALAEPLVVGAGLDLVDVEVKRGRGRALVRIVVDRKGGVPLQVCDEVSRALSARFDEADPIDARYTLEVTSPGVDRPLRDRAAFDRVEGRDVRVVHRDADGQVHTLEARVLGADADAVRLLAEDGGEIRLAYDRIDTAVQRLPW